MDRMTVTAINIYMGLMCKYIPYSMTAIILKYIIQGFSILHYANTILEIL